MTCTNDFTPIITQIAVSIPILLGMLVTWVNLRIAQKQQRAGHDVVASKLDALTTITVNGFHAPPNVIVAPLAPAPAAPTNGPAT